MDSMTRAGAALGNWNDRVNGGDTRTTKRHQKTWRLLDAVSSALYVPSAGPLVDLALEIVATPRVRRYVLQTTPLNQHPMFAAYERGNAKVAALNEEQK